MMTLRVSIEVTKTGDLIMPRELHPENLIPLNKRTKDARRKIAKMGAEASNKAQKERKLVSQTWAEFLAEEYNVQIDGEIKKLSGHDLFKQTAQAILARKDSSSVAIMKEIREATEGNKVTQTNKEIPANEQDLTKELAKIAEARGITLEELMQIEGI